MAEGDGVANQEIRVRLDETATRSDVVALKMWLEREKPLDELARAGRLRIDERQEPRDGAGAPMGLGMEIVVAMIGAGASAVFKELLQQVKDAVTAWQANRSDVEDGDPPEARVTTVDPDDR
ncbi:hypothetical protein [Streptomyces sp. NPDC047043]|uniref:hypothetical protein n=1 Tax=Streptomyces sp. NPDC047043 TaxID=3154497 RepID=UPI003406E5C3